MGDRNFLKYDENGNLIIPSYETKTITEKVLLLQEVQHEMTEIYEKKRTYHMDLGSIVFKRKDGPDTREWDIIRDHDEREVADFLLKLIKYPEDTMPKMSFINYPEALRNISDRFNDLATFYETMGYYDKIISQLILLEKGIKIKLGIS